MAELAEAAVRLTATRLLRNLHVALLIIVSAILLALDLPKVLAPSLPFASLPIRLTYFLLLLTIVAVNGVLLATKRGWGPGLWLVLALVFAGYGAFVFSQPPGPVLSLDNWYFDVIGWLGVLLLFDRPLSWFCAFLAGYVVLTAAPAITAGTADRAGLLSLAITAASVGGFQTCAAAATRALRWVAGKAAAAAAAAERTRTAEAVATRLHADGQRRYRELVTTTGPLLGGLADGTLDPADPDVRRRCAIEAARMRRLFAENDDHADRLLHELRAVIDFAERRGVEVHLITHGSPGELPREVRRALTDAPIRALSTARSTARVVVAGTPAGVSVSVLADCDADFQTGMRGSGVRVTAMPDGTRQWIEAAWQTN
ncbi:MAG TPA: hypothetical protein VJX66_18740 [Amycolatopsis sp.]|nr:hypothetical protein [Amycolatopsis sp.]